MKLKLSVQKKIIIYVLSVAVVLFAITIGFFSITSKRNAYSNLTELTNSYTDHYSAMVESWLNSDMTIVRTLSNAFLEQKQVPFDSWRELIMGMYKQVMHDNQHIDAIWDSWEFTYLDPKWDKPYGRWLHIYYREQGKLLYKFEKRSIDGDPPVYAALKAAGKESIVEPYLSTLQKGGLMTSLASPMYINGRYIGLVGIDLFLGRFQALICGIKPYPESYAFLLSNKGTVIAHPDTTFFGKKFDELYPILTEKFRILNRINKAERFSFVYSDNDGERYYYSFSPVQIGRTNSPWTLGIVVPERVILAEANVNQNLGILVGITGIVVLILVVLVLAKNITDPIKRITALLLNLSRGKVDSNMHISIDSGDEIAEMGKALSLSIDGLLAKTEFARSIGQGNLNEELKLLSDEDILGKSLLEMRESLKKADEEAKKRAVEEEKRRWINEGLTKFAEILRQNNDNLSKLGDEVIKNLVWYLDASLGGLFVSNETNSPVTYDLVSAFAYDRKRFIEKSFELGEGLIGSCAAERDTIYLKEIPQEYIEVTSGLGGVLPDALLIVPLKIEDDVLGVIEVASLKPFMEHELEFTERIAESIASTLRTVKINERTAELLLRSQEQAEMMTSQEEELRQNLEELQATQEEAARRSSEMEGLIEAINASSYVIEYDVKGSIRNINDAYLELLGITREDAIGRHHSDGMVMTDQQRMNYEEFWSNLRRGIIQKQTTQVKMYGRNFVFHETYTPIRNNKGEVFKILKIATDITPASRE